MEGLIGVVIWAAIIIIIVKKAVQKNAASGGSVSNKRKQTITPANRMPYVAPPKAPSGGAGSVYAGGASPKTYRAERATHTMMEDRSNDWLAHQLTDERRALYKANSMFGQQMEHRQICDAQMLKDYHLANCNADGIDMAEYK